VSVRYYYHSAACFFAAGHRLNRYFFLFFQIFPVFFKQNADASALTPEYCLKGLCLARLLLPKKDIRATAGRELYLKGREKEMLMIADSIFASGYLTAGGQSIDEAIKLVRDAGFEYRIE
jgi:biotin synthase-like enzyme